MSEIRLFHPLEDRSRKNRAKADKLVKIRTEHNGLSFIKTALTLFIVFLQLGIILSLNFLFAIGLTWYLILLAAISILSAVSVLSSHRSAQAKAVWVLFILVFFEFGFVVYFMSNDKIMYRRARKRHKKIFGASERYVGEYQPPTESWDMRLLGEYLHNAGGFTAYRNTRLKYFPSGASLADDILERLAQAEKFVLIEYFAIADGVLLRRICDILKQKMKEGVTVKIIYDDMGSRLISRKTRREIRAAGGEIRVFNKLLSRFTFALNYRDHRKIFVIDGKTAYTGGANLADEYINEKRMHGYWKDNGIRLEGEAVDALTLTFLRQWEFMTKKSFDYAPFFGHCEAADSRSLVLPYADGPDYALSIGKSVYDSVIASAKQRLYIMTPYFVPDDGMMQSLVNKALAGVDVRLVLPSVPDKYYVYLLSKDNAEKLMKYGVKIYYVQDAFVHNKTVLTENCAVVGTINFDLRSFYQQFENAVVTNDAGVLDAVGKDFAQTFEDSICAEKPEKKGAVKTVAVSLLRIVSPLM